MPSREPGVAENPVWRCGVLSLLSRGGEWSSRLRFCPTLSGHQGAYGRKPCAIWVVPRLYYSRPMERSVGRLFSSHAQEAVFISIAHRLNGLFARRLRCFLLRSVRIAAKNRLACKQKSSFIRHTLAMKTASSIKDPQVFGLSVLLHWLRFSRRRAGYRRRSWRLSFRRNGASGYKGSLSGSARRRNALPSAADYLLSPIRCGRRRQR